MPRDPEARLFHTLVLMGIGLTGGLAPVTLGCGGSTTTVTNRPDAAADADASDGAYATIGYHQPDASSADTYATIQAFLPDSQYAVILPAEPTDAQTDAQTLPECYPCIGFLQGDAQGPGQGG